MSEVFSLQWFDKNGDPEGPLETPRPTGAHLLRAHPGGNLRREGRRRLRQLQKDRPSLWVKNQPKKGKRPARKPKEKK